MDKKPSLNVSRSKSWIFIFNVAFAGLILCCGGVRAQDGSPANELEALRSVVKQLEKSLEEVRARLAAMEQKQPATAPTGVVVVVSPYTFPAGTTNAEAGTNYLIIAGQKIFLPPVAPFDAADRSPIMDYNTFNNVQEPAPRPDNKPIDPALKGFIPIPGTETMIRFGGSARLDAIYDFGDNGNPNQFIPSSIPVNGQPGSSGSDRTTLHTKGTRLSFEARRPAGTEGRLRIFNENDFFNDSSSSSMSFRVRHFYGQAWNILIGQTYSAFMDVDAFPDVLDYAGPNAMINRRQPQLRYSPPIYDGLGKMHLIFSVEQPESDLSTTAIGMPAGAETISRAPDGVVGWRWEGGLGHVQAASIFRQIGYEADDASDDNVFGWGVNLSGAFKIFEADKFSWQAAYGEGIGRYVNDLGSADLDAAPNSSGNLEAIPVFAGMIGYTHQWATQFRSTASFGYIDADPSSSLGAFALENTYYGSINLVWHPTPSFRMGLEYLYGRKETQDGSDGTGHRLNFVLRYDLIR